MLLDELVDLYEPVRLQPQGARRRWPRWARDCATCHHYSPPGRDPALQGVPRAERPTPPTCASRTSRAPTTASAWPATSSGATRRSATSATPRQRAGERWRRRRRTRPTSSARPTRRSPRRPSGSTTTPYAGCAGRDLPAPGAHRPLRLPLRRLPPRRRAASTATTRRGAQRRPERRRRCTRSATTATSTEPCAKCHDTKERARLHPQPHRLAAQSLPPAAGLLVLPSARQGIRAGRPHVHAACHGEWSPENFKHAVTGLRLDEVHAGSTATPATATTATTRTPVCSDCHDDGRTADKAPPGVHSKPKRSGASTSRGTTEGGTR